MANDPTFRDFAAAAMSGNSDEAARVLGVLLALEPPAAAAAATHFQTQARTAGPDFMMKAMGLRTAVTAPDDAPARELVAACFGLEGAQLDASVTALRARYRT
jgi:hypothetical protein